MTPSELAQKTYESCIRQEVFLDEVAKPKLEAIEARLSHGELRFQAHEARHVACETDRAAIAKRMKFRSRVFWTAGTALAAPMAVWVWDSVARWFNARGGKP